MIVDLVIAGLLSTAKSEQMSAIKRFFPYLMTFCSYTTIFTLQIYLGNTSLTGTILPIYSTLHRTHTKQYKSSYYTQKHINLNL